MPVLSPPKTLGGRSPHPRRSQGRGRGLPIKKFPGWFWPRTHRWRRRLLVVAGLIIGGGIIFAVGVVAWVSQDLPDPNKLNTRVVAQSTKIYARDGTTLLYDIHGDQRRTLVELSDVSPAIVQATLSIEDKDFYKHRGISLRGTLRAIFVDILTGRKSQGGSTITQQLVKNSILTNEKSFTRKIKEWILSYQIERRFTKEQILKLYFNEIPYGSNTYGIEAAAQFYFGKHAKELDLAESAMIAALVKAPTYYSPTGNHRDELLDRQHTVLARMVEDGYMTNAQSEEAKKIDIFKRLSPIRDRVVAPHFVFYIRDLLVQKYGSVLVERGGLNVVTTLDSRLQTIAEEEVRSGVDKNESRYNATNAALVAIDPKTGQLLAMVGSRDYFDTERDGNFNVATAVRNPGSSFKPVVYLTAFTKGYTPDTLLFDLKTDFGPDGSGKSFSPNNYDLKEHGPLKMRQTLAGSLNIPAVKTLYLAGIPSTVDLAEKLGYTTIDRTKVGLALAIGGGGVRLIEHTAAFGVLAADGVRAPTTGILKILDKNGKVLEQYQKNEERVVDQNNVRQVVDVMSDNNARAFVFGSRSPLVLTNRPVAAKTGTTNDFRDAWTVGFTPSLVAGVWRGNNDNSSMKGGADGVIVAAPIWHAFMERALQDKPVDRFTKPKATTATKPVLLGKLQSEVPLMVDSVTGKKIPDSCLSAWPKQFIKQQFIREVHEILYYVDKDNPAGPVPGDPESDSMFARWEKPVQAWAKKNKYVAKEPALEDCSLRTGLTGPVVVITSPTPNSTITDKTLAVSVTVSAPTGVASVAYYLDDSLSTTVAAAPFNTSIDMSAVSIGFHTIKVTATDTAGVTASAEVIINVLLNKAGQTVYFISPVQNQSVSVGDFPQAVSVFAYDPKGVAFVTLSLKAADGTVTVLDTVESPSDNVVTMSWPTTGAGSYQLFVVMKNKSGGSAQSDNLPIKVTSS